MRNRTSRFFIVKNAYLLSILSGIMIGTSYIPFWPWAVFFCFVPLWMCWLEEQSWRRIFWTGWLTQFVLTLIGFNWVAYTVHEFGNLPWWAAITTLGLFASFANLNVPLAGLAWAMTCRIFRLNKIGKIGTLPLFMALGFRFFPMIFDWHFGYTWLWAQFPAFQLADLIGFIGLSDISLIFNGLFLFAFWLWREKRSEWRWAALSAPTIFLILNIWGHFHAMGLPRPNAHVRFLSVQANINNEDKLAAEEGWAFRDTVLGRFTTLTRQGLAQSPADFVIWPETAFPDIIDSPTLDHGYQMKLKEFVASSGAGLITGGYSRLPATGEITNSFFVLGRNGDWLTPPYAKTMLLAFGEYLPGGNWFPVLYKWLPEVGHFGRGPGPTVLNTGQVKIGPQICYEGLFDWFARGLADKGAQIIVNITNDSWYGTWQQPYQHLYMTLAHAIEIRRPLIRTTNTGITGAILASGDILTLSPLHEKWFHLYDIPYATRPEQTWFMGWGYWFMPTFWLAVLVGFLIWSRERDDKSRLG